MAKPEQHESDEEQMKSSPDWPKIGGQPVDPSVYDGTASKDEKDLRKCYGDDVFDEMMNADLGSDLKSLKGKPK